MKSLVERGVVGVLTVTANINQVRLCLSLTMRSRPDGEFEGLYGVDRTVLSYELKPVELGQAGEGIAGGLQVEAGVLHDVILLLLSNSKNLAGMASTALLYLPQSPHYRRHRSRSPPECPPAWAQRCPAGWGNLLASWI